MTKQHLLLRLALLVCASTCHLHGQTERPKQTEKTTQSKLEASWKRVDTEKISGRAEKKVHQTTSWVDASKAYFTGTFKNFSFELRCLVSEKPGQPNQLVLAIGDQRQILGPVTQTWRLSWAGDSDGDGKLDFVILMVGEGGRDSSSSFLSTLAKPGELVGMAPYVPSEEDEDEGC